MLDNDTAVKNSHIRRYLRPIIKVMYYAYAKISFSIEKRGKNTSQGKGAGQYNIIIVLQG